MIEWSIEDDYCHIYNLYVEPEHRGKGNARKLLLNAIKEIRDSGWTDEILIVTDNPKLKRFYESLNLTVYEAYL